LRASFLTQPKDFRLANIHLQQVWMPRVITADKKTKLS
jgi:hypothetical protein